MRIAGVVKELDCLIATVVCFRLVFADQSEEAVLHDQNFDREFLDGNGAELIEGHLEGAVTADRDDLALRRGKLCTDGRGDRVAHGTHAAACQEATALHHIVVGGPELILTDIRHIDGIVLHLFREQFHELHRVYEFVAEAAQIHGAALLFLEFPEPFTRINRDGCLGEGRKNNLRIADQRNRGT